MHYFLYCSRLVVHRYFAVSFLWPRAVMKQYVFVSLPVMAVLNTIFLVFIGSTNKPNMLDDKDGDIQTNSTIKLDSVDLGKLFFSVIYIITGILVASISFLYYKYVQLQTSHQLINKLALGMGAVSSCGFIGIAYFQFQNDQQGTLLRHGADSLAFVNGNVYAWLVVIINSKDLPDNCTHGYVLFLRGVITLLHTLTVTNFGYKSVTASSNSFEYYSATGNLETTGTYFMLIFLSLFTFDLRRIKCINFTLELQERSPEEKNTKEMLLL